MEELTAVIFAFVSNFFVVGGIIYFVFYAQKKAFAPILNQFTSTKAFPGRGVLVSSLFINNKTKINGAARIVESDEGLHLKLFFWNTLIPFSEIAQITSVKEKFGLTAIVIEFRKHDAPKLTLLIANRKVEEFPRLLSKEREKMSEKLTTPGYSQSKDNQSTSQIPKILGMMASPALYGTMQAAKAKAEEKNKAAGYSFKTSSRNLEAQFKAPKNAAGTTEKWRTLAFIFASLLFAAVVALMLLG